MNATRRPVSTATAIDITANDEPRYRKAREAFTIASNTTSSASDLAPYTCKPSKLSKPPQVQIRRKAHLRNRLQKRKKLSTDQPPETLFVLQYEPYPYKTRPGSFLGVYSNINTVTAGAMTHGAYTFSKEGLADGSEYLNGTGRIRIHPKIVQRNGGPGSRSASSVPHQVRVANQKRDREGDKGSQRSKSSRSQASSNEEGFSHDAVFFAVHQSPYDTVLLGVFARKSRAWGACLKAQNALAATAPWEDEYRWTDEVNMPRVRGRVVGSGRHEWFVKVFFIDEVVGDTRREEDR